MKFQEFADINEEITNMTPTRKVTVLTKFLATLSSVERTLVIKMFCLDYPNVGTGEAGLIKRLEEYYQCYDGELANMIEHYEGLSELIEELGSERDCSESDEGIVNFGEVFLCLCQDNYKDAYSAFFDIYPNLSIIEMKWFIRYFLKEPRNGALKSTMVKVVAKLHGETLKTIKKASTVNSLDVIDVILNAGQELDLSVPPGVFRKPMLAKAVKGTPVIREPCIVDVKYDGIRAQIHKKDKEIIIFNRKGDDITRKFNDIVDELHDCGPDSDYVVDGEIYPITEVGGPDEFKKIMSRIHGKTQAVMYRTNVTLRIFDILYYNDEDIAETDYNNRATYLNDFGKLAADKIIVTNAEAMLEYYDKAIADGYEGIIIKPLTGKWEAGKRSLNWTKYKPARVDIDCVVTGASYGSGKRASVLGTYDIAVGGVDGEYISVGSVGTGFTDNDLTMMTGLFNRVGPGNIIIEVRADMITQDKKGNLGLRFPRFIKIREDKVIPTNISEVNEYV